MRALADAFRDVLRASDSMGRIGGEEFAFVLPNTDRVGAQAAGGRLLLAATGLCLPIGDPPIQLTVSIGVAEMVAADECADTLLARADAALYEAKRRGRNRVCLHDPGARGAN